LTEARPLPRYLVVVLLLAMAGFAAVGFLTIRRDVENLQAISQDNTQWAASQMEIELLRYRLALAALDADPTPAATAEMLERFDILWSRVFMMGQGELGMSLMRYDGRNGPVARLGGFLKEIDPAVTPIDPGDDARIAEIEARLAESQTKLRQYGLRVIRADGAAGALVRTRIEASARTTGFVSIAAVLVSALALILILRENRRQRHLAELSRRSAEQAELASRAKSRFLTMISHELRNPLHGVLGPLALLGESEMPDRLRRLVAQAQQAGQSLLQLLTGLLDYGEVQDGRLALEVAPFRVAALAEGLRGALAAGGAGATAVEVLPKTPERVAGDLDRLRQILLHLILYVVEGQGPAAAVLRLGHDGANLVAEMDLTDARLGMARKLDLLMDLGEIPPDQVTAEALRPLIARGLTKACGGALTVVEDCGRDSQRIRVTIPAEPLGLGQVRVHLETRSAALATLYRAALRSDNVAFVRAGEAPVDVVLVDTTSVGAAPVMAGLRRRFPGAVFVSLGLPEAPELFDDVVETPSDMSHLRNSIIGRFAS
jgi:signal transduction histidine kinase